MQNTDKRNSAGAAILRICLAETNSTAPEETAIEPADDGSSSAFEETGLAIKAASSINMAEGFSNTCGKAGINKLSATDGSSSAFRDTGIAISDALFMDMEADATNDFEGNNIDMESVATGGSNTLRELSTILLNANVQGSWECRQHLKNHQRKKSP